MLRRHTPPVMCSAADGGRASKDLRRRPRPVHAGGVCCAAFFSETLASQSLAGCCACGCWETWRFVRKSSQPSLWLSFLPSPAERLHVGTGSDWVLRLVGESLSGTIWWPCCCFHSPDGGNSKGCCSSSRQRSKLQRGIQRFLGSLESCDLNSACTCEQAPEVLMGGKCGDKVDIYSFGVMLWEVKYDCCF